MMINKLNNNKIILNNNSTTILINKINNSNNNKIDNFLHFKEEECKQDDFY